MKIFTGLNGTALCGALGAALMVMPANAVSAQTVGASSQGQGSGSRVDDSASGVGSDEVGEIVVTAQHRSENLQRVPISAQVFGQQALVQQNLTSLVSVAEIAPSVHVTGGGRSTNTYIRGTGSGESQSFDQSVGTFIDDIYHGRSRTSSGTFVDLDHLEILKGPQSTFFGNNAIAGAFNIVTRKPTDQFEGWARGLLSPAGTSGRQFALEGAVNTPVNDDIAIRVAGTYNGQNGWLTNVVTGDKAPHIRNYAARATVRYRPDEKLDITLKGELGKSVNRGGLFTQNENCPPKSPFPGAAGFCAATLAAGSPTGLDNNRYAVNPGGQIQLRTNEIVLTANYQLGEHTLTSVTGYYDYRFLLDLDGDGTPISFLNVHAPERYHQFSQELRIASPTGRPLEYMAGLYFQDDHLNIEQDQTYFFLSPTISSRAPLAPLVPYLPLAQQVLASQKERVYSAFAAVTWNMTDKLKLVGGLRYSIVEKDFDWQLGYGKGTGDFGGVVALPSNVVPVAAALGLGTPGSLSLSRKDRSALPSAKLQYQIDPSVMTYLSYSRGFKAGGFSVADNSAIPANYPFSPEHVNAYELGLKSQLFDRRLTLNLAAFWSDYTDLQVAIQGTNAAGSFVNYVRNAGSSRSRGVELESQFVFSPMFKIDAAATYLDSKYRSYPNAGPTQQQVLAGQTTQNLAGGQTPFAPTWSGNVSGTLTLPLGDRFRLSTEVTGIFSSSYNTYSTLDPLARQPSYGRLDMRMTLEPVQGRWGFDVIAKNLTSTVIREFSATQATSLGSFIQQKQQPFNIAFQLRYKF